MGEEAIHGGGTAGPKNEPTNLYEELTNLRNAARDARLLEDAFEAKWHAVDGPAEKQPELGAGVVDGPASLMQLVQQTRDELARLEQGLSRIHEFMGKP